MRASIHHFVLALLILYPRQVFASSVGKTDPDVIETDTSQASPSGQLVPRERKASNPYEALIARKDYNGIAELGKGMAKKKFIRDLCPFITTIDHYHGLHGFMESHYLTPSFLVHGIMTLVRKVMAGDGVKRGYFIGMAGRDAFTLSFSNKNYGRFIGLLTAEEQNHIESRKKEELLDIRYNTEIYEFYKKIDAVNNMQFKHFLLRHGEDLNRKYPITFKAACKELGDLLRRQTEKFKDFLGQPFSFPSNAIIETFSTAGLDIIDANFLYFAPREAFEECLTEPKMEALGKNLWEKIVEKFRGTDPAFPPSRETREHVLSRFPTKHQMEMAWTKNKVPNYEAVIATKRKVLAAYISSLDIFPKVLVGLTLEYVPVTCSWFYLPAK